LRNWTCSRLAYSAGVSLAVLIPSVAVAAPAATAAASSSATSSAEACAAACDAAAAGLIRPYAKVAPETLLLFSVTLDQLTLTEGLSAYGDPQDPLLPVGELTRLLEYDVEVLPTERRILGRLGESRTSLVVDLATGTARVGAKAVPLAPDDVAVTPTEIYLRASAFARLFPLTFKINREDLEITIVPGALIPVQSRLQRLARQHGPGGGPQGEQPLLRVPSPYRLATLPGLDVTLSAGYSSGGSQGPTMPFRYDIRAGGDLLYAGYEAYLGSDELGQPSTARFTLERRSVEGNLLGPLHARQIAIGDVFTPNLTIGPRSINGRGITISTVPLDQTNIFNRVDLRGELPVGYDVELYVNDVLEGGQNTPNKGRYEFLNVRLSRGVNVVRIVTYGPHGERSEETRIINVGGGQLQRGEVTFQGGVVQQEDTLVSLRNTGGTDFVSPAKGQLRAVGELNYGLTDLITLSAGGALIPLDQHRSIGMYSLGARASIFGFLTQLDIGRDTNGGMAEGVGVAGQLFGVSSVLRYVNLQHGFVDENGPGADFTRPLTSRLELSLDGNAQLASAVVPLSVHFARNLYATGQTELAGSVRASGAAAAVLYSAGFEYSSVSGAGPLTDRLTGFFAASTYRSFKWQIRSTFDYDIIPELKARAFAVTIDRDLSERASLRLGIGENLQDLGSFNLTASAITRTRVGDLALTADYNNQDQSWRLAAQVNFGLAYDPSRHGYQLARQGPGAGGSATFHAFMDLNGNGRYDPGEPGVANVLIEGGERPVNTNAQGRAFIAGLGSAPTARLNVSLDRLDNPSMKTPPTAIEISPRPGSVADVEFPMQPTSEIIARIVLRRPDGAKVGLSGVRARLVSERGQIAEANTEFDGSANFEELTPGTYRLELDPEQAKRLRMHLVAPPSIAIKGDGAFLPDVTAEVAFEPRPESPN
jgi:hypothetical protein